MIITKGTVVHNLRQLRQTLEDEQPMSDAETYLLYDVCQAIGLNDADAQTIIGPAYWLLIDAPIDPSGLPLEGGW